MSGVISQTEYSIKYTITHPYWICEWILPFDKSKSIKRSFVLNNNVDPLDYSNSDYIMNLIPGLFTDIQRIVKGWIESGDQNAALLLLTENKPTFITYAENIIGLKIIT
jgi:hypothetical protein